MSEVRAPALRAIGACRRPGRLAPVLLFALMASTCPCRGETVRWDPIRIAVEEPNGDLVDLDGIVLRPDDGKAHPLALINHGSPRDVDDVKSTSPFRLWSQTMWFARRGWTAVSFTRRGYGRSGGNWSEGYGRCGDPDYAKAGRAAAADIAGAEAFMGRQPYVALGRWISIGVSAGGFATVALTARPPSSLAAAIAFAPGRGSVRPDFVCDESRLIDAFATYGRTSRTPLLWVNAENDHFFGPEIVTKMIGAFTDGGGRVDHVAVPPFGSEGHYLFSSAGASIWEPIVDRFLDAHGLELRSRPIEVRPPDVAPPAGLGERGRSAFTAYLADDPNKAFAVATGHFGWAAGRATIEEARALAIKFCDDDISTRQCRVINVNDAAVP